MLDIKFVRENAEAVKENISKAENDSINENNNYVKQLSDLNGKTVYVAGQGATPEYMFKYLLQKNDIEIDTRKGVTLDYSIPTAQIAAELISGKIKYAVVPEPFATVAIIADLLSTALTV